MTAAERPPSLPARSVPPGGVSCSACPLRKLPMFQPVNSDELALIDRLKHSELQVDADTVLLQQGQTGAALYTLLEGWAIRYNLLPDGRRQILSVLMPGDFIGLQKRLSEGATYGVSTLTSARLCAFQRDALWTLHRDLPSLGYDLTWLAAQGEQVVDENLLTVGRRNARERVAALLLGLYERAVHHQLPTPDGSLQFPLTQQHLADALGLSRVHIQRTLRALDREGLAVWTVPGRLALPNREALARIAGLHWPLNLPLRPLI
jgi:CRP/FNR family transcriptional regulator, anaerobic regulatory protein